MRVVRAEVAGPDTARIELRPERVVPDEQRRNDPRFPAGGEAHLVAVNCQEVVDGDNVRGRIVDVSASGVAITTDRVLRRGDRLRFLGRFFTEAIEAEVRVMSIRGADTGRRIYGCRFLEIDAQSRDRASSEFSTTTGRRPRPSIWSPSATSWPRPRPRPAAGAAAFAARPDRSALTPRSTRWILDIRPRPSAAGKAVLAQG